MRNARVLTVLAHAVLVARAQDPLVVVTQGRVDAGDVVHRGGVAIKPLLVRAVVDCPPCCAAVHAYRCVDGVCVRGALTADCCVFAAVYSCGVGKRYGGAPRVMVVVVPIGVCVLLWVFVAGNVLPKTTWGPRTPVCEAAVGEP